MTNEEINDLKNRLEDLEIRLEFRDRLINQQREDILAASKRADTAEAECEHLKAMIDNTLESENLTIEKLTLVEIELDTEREQRYVVEQALKNEKALTEALEDVVKMTAKMRQQA